MAVTIRRGQGARVLGWSIAGLLLLIPAVAMRFTDEVRWTGFDFLVAALLIGGVGMAFEWAVRRSAHWAYRAGAGVALLAGFGLVWVNGAVGMIGDEHNPANWMFAAVLAVALGGAALARFQVSGLARAMLAAAIVQLLIAAAALTGKLGADGPTWPWDVIGASSMFTALWLLAALLFARAARFSRA